jgi:hypothetical protein
MKPHLKVGSYFIYSYNQPMLVAAISRPHIGVSFKIIKKKIYYEVKGINSWHH